MLKNKILIVLVVLATIFSLLSVLTGISMGDLTGAAVKQTTISETFSFVAIALIIVIVLIIIVSLLKFSSSLP